MKSTGALTLLICAFLMLSCGDGVPTLVPDSANTTAPAPVSDANTRPVAPVTDVTSTKLNPPHGQPGHRCDIAVGQPLNGSASSQPASLTTPATGVSTPAPAVTTTARPAAPSLPRLPALSPALALNPPHGQPGHRCDIQVGKPLNSQPASSNPVSLGSPAATTPVNTAPVLPSATTTAVAPGMNPPHGQPGHRCDIAVGKPLNSK